MNLLEVSGVTKRKDEAFVLRDINFTQQAFKKIAIAGETGSGKSTLLKIIGGLIQPDSGEVLFEGVRVLGPEEKLLPGHPKIAYLSQHFELRNNYRVEEELSYTNQLTDDEAATIYEVCQINHLLKRRTDQLSGGEKQRIATARLLISSPKLLLLDEPFSNLDIAHKNLMKAVIRDIGETLKISCILVSHDPLDTLSWADEIMILQEGEIIQQGSPEEVYNHPLNEYAAALLGSYNVITLSLATALYHSPLIAMKASNIVRPEKFVFVDEQDGVKGIVQDTHFFGSYYEIEVLVEGNLIIIRTPDCHVQNGDLVYVTLK
jgi:ABC-type sugar transport system ATPase subunit